jgi:hypothetical protein
MWAHTISTLKTLLKLLGTISKAMRIKYIASITKLLYILCILLSIQSCGGEQSGTINTNLEITSIKTNTLLYEETEIPITASVLSSNSNSISYQWRQVSGIPITLENNNQEITLFTAPNITANEKITLELTIQDSTGNTDTKEIELTLLYVNTPPVIAIEKSIAVEELSEVTLTGDIFDNESNVIRLWQQTTGTQVEIISQTGSEISFNAPTVSTIETLEFELTVTDNNNLISKETILVTVLPHIVDIPDHVLLLTNERINEVKRKIAEDNTAWIALTNKIDNYFVQVPYNAGEYAGSFALAFYISGETKYMQRAIELLEKTYFIVPDIGWQSYDSRNSFRSGARWAIMGYTWIKSYVSQDQQIKIESFFALWAEYWLEYIDFNNDFKNFRIGDSDEVTSLAENLTLLGYALSGSSQHANLSQQLLSAGDTLLNRFVVGDYMNDIMAGGAWAEGSDYSPNTQRHWIRIFMINKDQRDISYPTNYAHDAIQALIHQTLANYSSMYKYGDEEVATDHEPLSDDYRYEFALELMGLLEDEKDLAQLSQWFNTLLANDGYKKSSMTTHFQRLLYHNPLFNNGLSAYPESTFNVSPGVGLIGSRSDWTNSATNLYFINRKLRVDHEHRDALSFDVAHSGNWITKEVTGYDGPSALSIAHNTILIENADNGSSNPTRRPAGEPKYLHISNDQHTTLISADATDTYNMSGYYTTNYAELVNRQLAFIKPSIVITYDHVITFPDQIKDLIKYNNLDLTQGMSYTRWVKTIQHFQAKPKRQELLNNTFVINDGKSKVLFQNIWPVNATIEVVDEQKLWADVAAYQVPENQKKWHLSISNNSKTSNSELINIMQFSSTDEDIQFDQEPIVMTKKNGYIKSDNIIGVAVSSQSEKFIILFNQSPNNIIENVEYTLPSDYDNALVYGIGVNLK